MEDLALALTGVMTTSGGVGCLGVTTPGGVTIAGCMAVVMVSFMDVVVTETVSSIEYPSSGVMGVEERRGEPIGLLSG